MSRSSSTLSSETWMRSARSGSSFRQKMPRLVRGSKPKWIVSGSPSVLPSATFTGSTSPIRSPTLVSGVASFSPYRSPRGRQTTARSSPCSAARRRQRAQTGANGWSLISHPATAGVHSSSRPVRVLISRVLPWPRSPSRMTSCPAMRARSRCGSTVWPKPMMPGNASSPVRIRCSRLCRNSCLTVRSWCPLARSSPSVEISGGGDADGWSDPGCLRVVGCTIRHYVEVGMVRILGGAGAGPQAGAGRGYRRDETRRRPRRAERARHHLVAGAHPG